MLDLRAALGVVVLVEAADGHGPAAEIGEVLHRAAAPPPDVGEDFVGRVRGECLEDAVGAESDEVLAVGEFLLSGFRGHYRMEADDPFEETAWATGNSEIRRCTPLQEIGRKRLGENTD